MIFVIALALGLGVPQGVEQSAARPNPDAAGRYHVGDGVSPPAVTHQEDPQFLADDRTTKIQGKTIVSLIVDTNGTATNVRVFRSMTEMVDKKHRSVALLLDQKAVDAVKKYRFDPATYQGKPVAVEIHVAVNFDIR